MRAEANGAEAPRLNLVRTALLVAAGYWLFESLMHAYVFGRLPLSRTLVCEGDWNELSMRATIALLLVAFGGVAQRAVRSERTARERVEEILRLFRYVGHVSHETGIEASAAAEADPRDTIPSFQSEEAARLAQAIEQFSRDINDRFREFLSVLVLTREISSGVLVNEVLDRTYEVLRPAVPYDRIGVALVDDDNRHVTAIWARSDNPETAIPVGYTSRLMGSSLQGILETGEARIINDLTAYLVEHPDSDATRRIVADGIRSSLTCPLIFTGRAVGFVFFSSRTPGTYSERHRALFGLISGHLSAVIDKARTYERLLEEKRRSETLLLNVMPARIAERLRTGEESIADELPRIGILFADIVGFTSFASSASPEQVVHLLRRLFVRFDQLCEQRRIEKIKTIGDAYMAVSGTPGAGDTADLADLALDMLTAAAEVRYPQGHPVQLRIGINLGPVIAGVIGQKKFSYDVWGDAVNVASRLEATGEPGAIHVSEAVHAEIGGRFLLEPRGDIAIRGKGSMRTYFLRSRLAAALRLGG
jgi:class 3 adenylate cyclase